MTPIPRRAGLFLSLLMLLSPFAMRAEVPALLNHQGVLTDSNGVVLLDGDYLIRFGIWDSPSLGNELFFQEITVSVVGGMYNVLLSEVGLLDVFDSPQRFLEIEIVDDPHDVHDNTTLTPRQQFASVPYALAAENLPVVPASPSLGGAANLVPCGSFECMDPSDNVLPTGWGSAGTPLHAYVPSAATEGQGLAYQVTASAPASGITYTFSGLKANATYYAVARAKANAGDSCDLIVTTTGGTDLVSQVTTTAGSFETLSGTFITGAASTAAVLQLRAVGDTDVCEFDHVGVFEQSSDSVPTPGNALRFSTDWTNVINDSGGSGLSVTVPGDSYYLRISSSICVSLATAATDVMLELREDAGAGSAPILRAGCARWNTSGVQNYCSVPLTYIRDSPTPGTTYTYTIAASGSGFVVDGSGCSGGAPSTSLGVELIRKN